MIGEEALHSIDPQVDKEDSAMIDTDHHPPVIDTSRTGRKDQEENTEIEGEGQNEDLPLITHNIDPLDHLQTAE